VALAILAVPRAHAETAQPLLLPTRDVDVSYSIIQNGRTLPQRIRWMAGARLLRIDPPVQGMFVIVDYDRKRMSMVREAEHAALDMTAPASVMAGLQNRLDTTTRGTDETVAGLTCTNWQTTDAANKPATACITRDGVLLQIRSQGQPVLTANSVRYAPQEAALFRVPDGYMRIPADRLPGMSAR
jgi:hypothetical protein